MRKLVPLLALALLSTPLAAQESERPEGWKVRFDRASANPDNHKFVTMEPGWHVTTGPAGIMWNADRMARGQFRIESETHLFPTNGRNREGFGVLFGGQNLPDDSQSYTYFLIRNDGSFLVKRRIGTRTPTVVGWTQHSAIVRNTGEGTAKNILAVEAGTDEVAFYINGEKVTSVPRGDVQLDGVVGLRVNHGIDLHVSSLSVTHKTG